MSSVKKISGWATLALASLVASTAAYAQAPGPDLGGQQLFGDRPSSYLVVRSEDNDNVARGLAQKYAVPRNQVYLSNRLAALAVSDTDRNNSVSYAEALAALDGVTGAPPDGILQANELPGAVDTNVDGMIDAAEYLVAVSLPSPTPIFILSKFLAAAGVSEKNNGRVMIHLIRKLPLNSIVVGQTQDEKTPLLVDKSVEILVNTADGVWEMYWSDFDFVKGYGTRDLVCTADDTDQCFHYYTGFHGKDPDKHSFALQNVRLHKASGLIQQCRDPQGRFNVADVLYQEKANEDGTRAIFYIGLDFEQYCSELGDPGRLVGSVRVFSGATSPWYDGFQLRGDPSFMRREFPRRLNDTSIFLSGLSGPLGISGNRTIGVGDATITAKSFSGDILKGVRVTAAGPKLSMTLDFAGGQHQPLHANCRNRVCYNYLKAQRRSSKDDFNPGIELVLNGNKCATGVEGRFIVREAYYTPKVGVDMNIEAFAADFTLNCKGDEGIVKGSIRFNSDVPNNDLDEDGIPDSEESGSARNFKEPDNFLLTDNLVDGNLLFARQGYRDFFRDAEAGPALYSAITPQLDAGTLTRPQFIQNLMADGLFANGTGGISRLYQAVFDRNSDASGLNYWVKRYYSDTGPLSLGMIADIFTKSPEFQTTYGALNNTDFVRRVYQNVLKREPDAGGNAFWLDQLNTGKINRGTMVVGFSEGPEFKALTLNDTNITLVFFALYKRSPTDAQRNFWKNGLVNGTQTLTSMIDVIIDSQEYCERFLDISYCRVTTP